MAQRKLALTLLALAMIAALLFSPGAPVTRAAPDAPDATYEYTVTPTNDTGTTVGVIPDNGCGQLGWPNTRYFLVYDHFNVTDLNVRFSATHGNRGDIRMTLTSPPDAAGDTVSQILITTSTNDENNFDILLDADGGGGLYDGPGDTTADPVDRTVSQPLLNNFEGRDARGAWRMDICDNTSGNTGALVLATLYFTGDPITFLPPTFTQGPAVLETYYIPYPESQLWTAMGTLFYADRVAANGDTSVNTDCLDYDFVNANPRQPMIGYTGVTIGEANTVVYYDHWEDGFEPAISYPTQNTTEVWGDGILTNGRAPADADDLLDAGQIVVLNDVKDSTVAEVVDYDARDKLASTAPVAVSRSLWANGSTTLFAAADEVYPTSRWGTDYRIPVGETTNTTYDYFQYTGVLVLAAEDGTVVHIDRDNNGTDEKTCNLGQGGVCQWDDMSDNGLGSTMGVNNVIGNGLIAGSRVWSNKKIQVSLVTGDVCAGYETRSYTLLPTTAWSNQYYAPVSSSTSSRTITIGGTSTTHTLPTQVTLYNPGTAALTVNWTFGTGATGSQSIAANTFYNVTIPNGTAARFYSTGNFYAVGTIDANSGTDFDGAAADWGYTLVPVTAMSQYIIVGWAPGADPNIAGATEDSAPIWLTGGHTINPASTTAFTVCIDEGGDGGSNLDSITDRYYDRTITVTPFQQQIVYDNRTGVYGETGMQLWVCDATNGTDAVITAAWGEDPDTINSFGKPTMDMGYTMRNLSAWNATKGVSLQTDLNGNGLYDEGDTARFTITVNNKGAGISANTIKVTDVLPAGVKYVANSTWVDYHDASPNLNLTDGVTTPFPLDDEGGGAGGYTYSKALPAAQSFTVYFDVTINAGTGGVGGNTVCNVGTATDGTLTQDAEACLRVQAPVRGAIGNYVWFDEDGDGDQDAGEAGIPNVTVQLYQDTNNDGSYETLVATTYTDANGGYLFDALLPGSYRVDVVSTTLPDPDGGGPGGLYQTYDEDNGTGPFTTPHSTPVTLGSGEEHLTADFGYNWSTPCETNTPGDTGCETPLGAIGDRVWLDADGDGVQDMGEAGIADVPVQLWYDSDEDGDIDRQLASTTTNAAGYYIFDELPAGIYEVRVNDGAGVSGYTQTGDPDQFGATCTSCDHITTTPILLGPGDVFLNADFGYQLTTSYSIGNTVFFDANANGTYQPANGEYGINGVTVALIRDNGDGIYNPAVDKVVATTITGDDPSTSDTVEKGWYQFAGLPDGTQYFVWVTDTENVLGEVKQSGEPGVTDGGVPCVACNDRSPSVVTVGPNNVLQDFGYTPDSQELNGGAIGDFVWLDKDGDGVQDAGEPGLEGAVVRLYDNAGALLTTTTTDENGYYYFGNLAISEIGISYTVQVLKSSLPAGLTETYDYDGIATASTSAVSLTTTTPIRLDQDFGYRPVPGTAGSIGNYVWVDSNADGINNEPAANGIGGVTIDLYQDRNNNGVIDSGDRLVGQTTTLADGSYLFDGLPAGNYLVDVTDDAQVLNGYWHSLGNTAQDVDNNSKLDPHQVTLTAGENYVAADFGYYVKPGAVGNFVWDDLNGNGVQDAGEPGIDGITVTLTAEYIDGSSTVLTTVTGDDPSTPAVERGWYSFGNLLSDEDYRTSTTGDPTNSEPSYTISIQDAPAGYAPTRLNQGSDMTDADDPTGVKAVATEGQTNVTQNAAAPGSESDPIAGYDFGYTRTGAIGNYVWFDEDGDGDQDAGEAGIPNVTVQLYQDTDNNGSYETPVATTYTDANGGYLFDDLPAGSYRVDVVSTTLPDPDGGGPGGLHQTYDEDNGTGPFTTAHSTPVTLGSGEEHLTADFGYNWSTPCETNTPGGTGCPDPLGAIGDRVWLDADGDGVQDMGEAGIADVPVQLWYDSDGNGDIDTQMPSTTTDAAGYYIFDQLPAGIYEVRVNGGAGVPGYSQTGDPDQLGATCTSCDNVTTTPIVLAPGDVFLNADFGYRLTTSYSIGNTVFFDANADGTYQPAGGEYGINGVTVALIRDDGDDTYEPGIDQVVATTITGDDPSTPGIETGWYQFAGLPGGSGYFVWVTDTENVLGEVKQSGEPGVTDGGVPCVDCNDVSPEVVAVGPNNVNQDFGYTPDNQVPNRGAIGDTVFLDANGDGLFQPGEGIEGVTVTLYDNSSNPIAVTVTDENGYYYFGNLNPNNVTYVVKVGIATLPNGGVGLTNHVDPNGGGDSQSSWTLTPAAPINLNQDFGYIPETAGSIGNYVWVDSNADGINNEPAANGIGGVTIDLYEDLNNNGVIDTGDRLVGQTTTAADGSYRFDGLPAGNYLVDVTDDAQVLNGYWHSLGNTAQDVDNNSKLDPHQVTLSAGENYVAADFGYYVKPGAVGNRVWEDKAGGIPFTQDSGDAGIANAIVVLTITYPNGDTTVLQTVTDANGYYSFGNLLQDEDYAASTTGNPLTIGLPQYVLTVDRTQPVIGGVGKWPTQIDAAGNDAIDADNYTGVAAEVYQGQTNTTGNPANPGSESQKNAWYDFGFQSTPLAVDLAFFEVDLRGDGVYVAWESVSEADIAGFNVLRAESLDGDWVPVNGAMIAALTPGASSGNAYEFVDTTYNLGSTYYYVIEAVSFSGATDRSEPIELNLEKQAR